MGQHRTKKEKQQSVIRREQQLQHLYSLSHIQTVSPTNTSKQSSKNKITSLFVFDKKHFYMDLLKTVIVTTVILALEIILWIKLK